jgi:SAM-dependent methyltransferase
VDDASADVVFSHVVFQHVPDPAITLGYVRDMGRVLRPGGWAAFQVSNDPSIHQRRSRDLRWRLDRLLGRAPGGQENPAWLGSAVELDDLRAAARDGGLEIERLVGEGTQFCLVLLRRRA